VGTTHDTFIIDTWDAAVVERFDSIRMGASRDRIRCGFHMSSHCLTSLDQTLNELRTRSRQENSETTPAEDELIALRSAAVEVAAGAYIAGVRERREPSSMTVPARTGSARHMDLKRIECLLPPRMLTELDEVLGVGGKAPKEVRDVAVESAISSWLILRGYAAVTPRGSGGRLRVLMGLVNRRQRG
jgi:hypothetical protein